MHSVLEYFEKHYLNKMYYYNYNKTINKRLATAKHKKTPLKL